MQNGMKLHRFLLMMGTQSSETCREKK